MVAIVVVVIDQIVDTIMVVPNNCKDHLVACSYMEVVVVVRMMGVGCVQGLDCIEELRLSFILDLVFHCALGSKVS
jgi:hypothetical protein